MNIRRLTSVTVAMLCATITFAQDDTRWSSSVFLPTLSKPDATVSFDIKASGKRFEPTWGLDQADISAQVIKKGINHMGKENIGLGRVAFRYTVPLIDDTLLHSNLTSVLSQRCQAFNSISNALPLIITADQGAVEKTDVPEYYVTNKAANVDHWAAMINSHVDWILTNTRHPVIGISPFNEGDYWSREEGATPEKHMQVARILKERYPRCADITMIGANTLNNDKALNWYTTGKQYYDWANTHQLAGTFDSFATFYQQVKADGKVGIGDEMHNVGEAMVGLEYGMTVGIWWGFDSRARGEFCQISRKGVRLSYGEHRANWTAASVWRHDDGRVKAFLGSSERQAATTDYQFVSTDRAVYYDGYGPQREFVMRMPGGTGYQNGQANAERVIDVTWGEDVQPQPVTAGVYKIYNKSTGTALTLSGSDIIVADNSSATTQQWNVAPSDPYTSRWGGDYSFFDITSKSNSSMRLNVVDFSTSDGASVIAYGGNPKADGNEQWYLEYAGGGYFYIRNRESSLYLGLSGSSVVQKKMQSSASAASRLQWRLLPVDVSYETRAPQKPAGLTAEARPAAVTLTWNAVSDKDVDGYMVLRSRQDAADWNTIARYVKGTTFTDNTCRPGTAYIYKVKAIDKALNSSAASDVAAATPTGERGLVAQWTLDETLDDATVNMMDARLCGTPNYTDGNDGTKALWLRGGSGQYLQLPYEVASSEELTVAMWVNMRTTSTWERLFDFGNDQDHYLFLTTGNNNGKMCFGIKNGGSEQTLECTKLPSQKWKHVALTIGGGKTTIYVDGEVAATTTTITLRPSDVQPCMNYLGRSQFASDPLLNAYVNDVRIYNYAVSSDDVKTIMGGGTLTGVERPVAEPSMPTVYGLDGVRRTTPQRGLNIIDGKKVVR